jgi:hypothetical protein
MAPLPIAFEVGDGLLVLTDRDSADTTPLYEGRRGVEAGQSSIVFRQVDLDTLVDAGDPEEPSHGIRVMVRVLANGSPPRAGNVWSGTLSLPSGTLIFASWGMQQIATLDIAPGNYQIDIQADHPDDPSELLIDLEPGKV